MRKWIVVGAAALAACGKEPTTPGGPGAPATVVVTAATTAMVVGATQQLEARVSDASGRVITTALLTWSSAPTTVVSVSQTGVATAVSAGTATVSARTAGGISGSISIRVDPDPCQSTLTLAAGEVRTFVGGGTVSCVVLGAAAAASEYVVIAANTRPAQDDTVSYTLSLGSAVAASVLPALNSPEVQAQLDPRLIRERQDELVKDRLHERLRRYERDRLTPAIRGAAARSVLVSPSATETPSLSMAVATRAPGDTVTIRVPNLNTGKDICRDNIPIRGVVRAVSARATIVEDITSPSGGFTTSDFAAIAQEFDDVIFPVDTAWFGRPTDINNDGRITILYTPEVNKLTPANASGFTAGFFFGSDLLRRTDFPATNECRNQTNEQEIFYLLTADPQGQFNNVRTTVTVRQSTRGVIAHEFQHMINQGVRQFNPAVQALETFWLNEAMSHMAEEAVGRAIRNFGDFQDLSFTDINPNPAAANDYNAFFRQNLARFQRWMQRPDTAAAVSVRNQNQLAPRGASWAFVRYAADHYGGGNARSFFRRLAAGPETDVTNLRQRANGVAFDELVSGFLVANYVDGLAAASSFPSRSTYRSWNIRSVMSGIGNGTFPLLVQTLPGTFSSQAISSSGNYHRLTRAAGSGPVTIRMTSPGGTPLTSSFATLIVARLN